MPPLPALWGQYRVVPRLLLPLDVDGRPDLFQTLVEEEKVKAVRCESHHLHLRPFHQGEGPMVTTTVGPSKLSEARRVKTLPVPLPSIVHEGRNNWKASDRSSPFVT